MARPTHYETLGLPQKATEKDIKAAYRRVVLKHHPDRNPDPASTRIFMAATEAYQVLIDDAERRSYDRGLENEARRQAERQAEQVKQRVSDSRTRSARAASTAPRPGQGPRTATGPTAGPSMATQLARLSMLFSRGLYAEAEKLADEIVLRDPRQPLPYAIKGDLARQRGKLGEAERQYSLAIQMDPRNPTYVQRYEEILARARPSGSGTAFIPASERMTLAALALGSFTLLAGAFLYLSPEKPALAGLGPVATWTVGMAAMLFLCGVAAGACLAAGGGLERLNAYTDGRIGPTLALGLVSIVSFPAAGVLYVMLGLAQKGFNLSTTRLMVGVGSVVLTLAVAAGLSKAGTDPVSVLLWGGNVAYLGSLCGWAVADGLRGP